MRSVCNGRDSLVTIVWAATHRPSAQASNAPPKEKDIARVASVTVVVINKVKIKTP